MPQFDFSDMYGGAGGMGSSGGMGSFGGLGGMINPGTLSMFGGLFGGGNQNNQYASSQAAMPYLNQIGTNITPYFNPYINAGQQALPQLQQQYGNLLGEGAGLQNQYNQLMNDPTSVMNKIGAGFQQSPGYQWQVNQSLGAANRAAAAGGMVGSPAEQQQIAGTVNQLANQDYYNYLNHGMSMYNTGLQGATNLYGMGLQGEQDLAHMGLSATNSLTDDLMSQYLSQASDAYAGGGKPQGGGMGGIFSGALGGAATGSSFGPYGALIGAGVGALGGYMSNR